jgi:DMSO/TMAO reductase YedYZ molybdopterin-dependent catalytic subunit
VTPAFAALDPTTGLHITGIPQTIDLASYRLEVSGKVDHPLQLSYDDLRCMPKVEKRPQLVCQGYFVDSANWAGVPIGYILSLAGVQKGATRLKLTSADGYSNSVQLTVADSDDNFLAYELEGQTLPLLHGFPLRAVFSHLNGNTWIKWLVKLEVD